MIINISTAYFDHFLDVGKMVSRLPTSVFTGKLSTINKLKIRVFLKSEKIEQRMLAILGDLATENIEEVFEQILLDIEPLNLGELIEGRYRRQLRVLLELRNLDKQTYKDIALVGKILKKRKTFYISGMK